jgi:hypothetical protein
MSPARPRKSFTEVEAWVDGVEDLPGRVKSILRTTVEFRQNHVGVEIKDLSRRASPKTAQCPIGHARGRMAGCSQAPVLILTAPDALAPSIAVAIRTAAA